MRSATHPRGVPDILVGSGLIPEVVAPSGDNVGPLVLHRGELNPASVDVGGVAAARPPAHDLEPPVAAAERPVVRAGLPVVPLAPPAGVEGPPTPALTVVDVHNVCAGDTCVLDRHIGRGDGLCPVRPAARSCSERRPAEDSHRIYATARSEEMSWIVKCEHAAAVHVTIDVDGQRARARTRRPQQTSNDRRTDSPSACKRPPPYQCITNTHLTRRTPRRPA